MLVKSKIIKNVYIDSVTLMSLTTKANELDCVEQVVLGMGTDMNKQVLINVGMQTKETETATKGDLMIVVKAETEDKINESFKLIDELIEKRNEKKKKENLVKKVYKTQNQAYKDTNSNLAVISVAGDYAVREANIALDNNNHVFLFSDNISIEDEVKLKKKAISKNLLLMGPDCGTAIIDGIGICFANKVRKGNIAIVGASGTGSQEISVRIHDFGGGISQLIGTGGRDLSKEVGGLMMIKSLEILEKDNETDIIVIVSKPPQEETAKKVLEYANTLTKKVIVCFIGGNDELIRKYNNLIYAKTTKDAALKAVVLSGVDESSINKHPLNLPLIKEIKSKLNDEQKYVAGLFCGGTICDEVFYLIKEKDENVYSNIAKDPKHKLKDIFNTKGHRLIDFGSDEFTQGRPHPMIDPSVRIEYFEKLANDKSIGVIALDFILGFGAHDEPVSMMLPVIKKAQEKAKSEGRHLEILGFVLGTDEDKQNFSRQCKLLDENGITWASSSVNTALLSIGFVEKE